MKILKKPKSVTGVRKSTRILLEKLKDLSKQRKFEKVLHKNNLCTKYGKVADIQISIDCVIECYNCFLSVQFSDWNYPKRKQVILYNNLITLADKVKEAVINNKPISVKYISNVLKSHTIYFNKIKSKKINNDCTDPYDKLVLSAISVWNNDWN